MRSATRAVTSAFGAMAALTGMEHGVGEILQGNVRPEELMIQSWPDSPFFRIEAGEPAMTVVPNLLASGLLNIVVSLVFLVWAVGFAHRKHGGLVLIGLSIVLLLVGGGFGPPLLGIIIGLTATRIGAPLTWWHTRLAPTIRRLLATLWPWAFAACIGAWLMLVPGLPILSYTLGVEDPALVVVLIFSAFGLLALTIVSGLARDAGRQTVTVNTVARKESEMKMMSAKILVAYATRYGSTREVAEAAGTALREQGVEADVKPARDVAALGGYGGAVLATPFYMGSMLKDATQFLERNRASLQGLPVAVLACGPVSAADDMAGARKQLDDALAKLEWLKPVASEMFVGKYDPAHLRLLDKLIALPPASPLHGVDAHDDRDWESIRAWAEALPAAMGVCPNNGSEQIRFATAQAATARPRGKELR